MPLKRIEGFYEPNSFSPKFTSSSSIQLIGLNTSCFLNRPNQPQETETISTSIAPAEFYNTHMNIIQAICKKVEAAKHNIRNIQKHK